MAFPALGRVLSVPVAHEDGRAVVGSHVLPPDAESAVVAQEPRRPDAVEWAIRPFRTLQIVTGAGLEVR